MRAAGNQVALVQPTGELHDEFAAMAREYAQAGEPRHAAALDDFDAYVSNLRAQEKGEGLPDGYVPSSTFWLVVDGRAVGVSRLRHRLTAELEQEGGHIGYDIRPGERGHGLGKLLFRLTLLKATERGLKRVLLTCDNDDTASVRVIEANGGRLAETIVHPKSGRRVRHYWIDVPSVLANHALQRTHSRVTPLAEGRKRRATRRAAERER